MARKTKKQQIVITLLKADTPADPSAFAKPEQLTTIKLKNDLPFTGSIYLRASKSKKPPWFDFLQSGTDSNLSMIYSASASALVMLQAGGRVFCVTFGHSRHFLLPELIERKFGIKVALNCVPPNDLNSVDSRQIDIVSIQSTLHSSRTTSIDTFGLDFQRVILRGVTGIPADTKFAELITGGENNLSLKRRIKFEELGKLCESALEKYNETTYKDEYNYNWFDYFHPISDPVLVNLLDNKLLEAIVDGDWENLFFASPRVIDYERFDGYRYTTDDEESEHRVDIDPRDFFETLDDLGELTIEDLKKNFKIQVYYVDYDGPIETFSVYDAIVFETLNKDTLHVLSYGDWINISKDYLSFVDGELKEIDEDDEVILPSHKIGEREDNYNSRASKASNGELALLDKKNVTFGGGHSKIEVCDLLSKTPSFIHVKKKSSSASLSHLFAQGLNSAQLFLYERDFRLLARNKAPDSHKQIFTDARPNPTGCPIIYAIITDSKKPIKNALPFFSKQALVNAAKELKRMEYPVRLKKIESL